MLDVENQSVADWRMLKGVHAWEKPADLQSLLDDWHIVECWGETGEDGNIQYGLFEMSKISGSPCQR